MDKTTAGTTAILAVVPIIDQMTAQKAKCKNDLKCIQITLILFHISIYTIYMAPSMYSIITIRTQ